MTCSQSYRSKLHPQFAEYDESDYDDLYDADDYDEKQRIRDGWTSVHWDMH